MHPLFWMLTNDESKSRNTSSHRCPDEGVWRGQGVRGPGVPEGVGGDGEGGSIDTMQDKQEVVRWCSNSELLCRVFTAYLTVWLGWALPQLVRRGEEEESEVERIQELFPHDDLRLHERDPVTQKMKGLMRKRSTTAARLQRAFSAKGLRAPNAPEHQHNNNKDSAINNNSNNGSPGGLPPNRTREGRPKRQFIMETPVTFTTGVQSQERHLFLFSDLLLVAKARSGGNFKLKEKVRVSEMWLSSCLDDVAEVAKSQDTSFVMGWPTMNVVASFRKEWNMSTTGTSFMGSQICLLRMVFI